MGQNSPMTTLIESQENATSWKASYKSATVSKEIAFARTLTTGTTARARIEGQRLAASRGRCKPLRSTGVGRATPERSFAKRRG